MTYAESDVLVLLAEVEQLRTKQAALIFSYLDYPFTSSKAREYAHHGFCRRIAMLSHSIIRIFETIPPDVAGIPTSVEVADVTLFLQGFVMNLYGCIDNIAWLWVHEKSVTDENGRPLKKFDVGLGKTCKSVRKSLPSSIVQFLDGLDDWYLNAKDFRDALAHRIPLYIPPFTLPQSSKDSYERLENEAFKRLVTGEHERFEQLMEQRDALRGFDPVMTHSWHAPAKIIRFHPQILTDFMTVHELGTQIINALAAP